MNVRMVSALMTAIGLFLGSCASRRQVLDTVESNSVGTGDQEILDTWDIAPSLRSIAQAHGLEIGAAVQARLLQSESDYALTLACEFSMLTPENEMKFHNIHPQHNQYFWDKADAIVDFAEDHGMKVRGHTLVWHQRLPAWLKDLEENLRSDAEWSPEDRLLFVEIIRDHIMTTVGRYRGRIMVWDVINEAIARDGSLKNTIWLRTIGPEYIEMAFRWAHEADPGARLFYNDYGNAGLGTKSDAIYTMVSDLLDKGVPIHGMGFQMHLNLDSYSEKRSHQLAFMNDVLTNMARLSSLGLEIHITEMDVAIKDPEEPDTNKLVQQAKLYRDMLQVGLCAENFQVFGLWGFTDKYSWVPYFYGEHGAALIFDENYDPKLAYYAIIDLLENPGDSDGDGLPNCLEILWGTDPFDNDTDDDVLLDGPVSVEDLNANGTVDRGEPEPGNS